MPRTTRIFISYSRDSEQHKDRLREFVERLRALEGLEVIYDDNWDNNDYTRENLKRSIHDADYVLCICTPSYKQEVKEPLGKKNWEKYIPVLFEGDWETSSPHWLIRKKGFDYTDKNLEQTFINFVSTLKSPETMASSSLPPEQEHKNLATKSIDNGAPAGTTPRIGKVALKLKNCLLYTSEAETVLLMVR